MLLCSFYFFIDMGSPYPFNKLGFCDYKINKKT